MYIEPWGQSITFPPPVTDPPQPPNPYEPPLPSGLVSGQAPTSTVAAVDGQHPAVALVSEIVVPAPSGRRFVDGELVLTGYGSSGSNNSYSTSPPKLAVIGWPVEGGTKWKFVVKYQTSFWIQRQYGVANMTTTKLGA